jgi:hypothetical protein
LQHQNYFVIVRAELRLATFRPVGRIHAAAYGLSREQIEDEILNGRDLSKKVQRHVG